MGNVSVYESTVPQFILGLNALKGILQKAQAFAETKKVDMAVLFQSRLAPDQFPLSRQIQIMSDSAKFAVSRLSGVEAPAFEDNEQTLEQFMNRVDKTIAYLQKLKPEQFAGYEQKVISFPRKPGFSIDGKSYLIQHAIPNFYFHYVTAYSILRACGVDLGKTDFLGAQNWKAEG